MSPSERTIGRYRIISQLGAGGMGVVYRAEDTALGREVAIKVLRPELGARQERVRRFSQEARATSALNHPNIVAVYDAGEFEDGPFLVMELVEGESLRSLFRRRPLPLAKTLDIGIQGASALARAHEAGITHRDLKPENILVRPDGCVKILDFGLAKLREPENADNSTETTTLTAEGAIMGTAAYMSPEQATGRAADGRSDIFSLALVLFEAWQGRNPFVRENPLGTLHAITNDRLPALTYLAGTSDWGLDRILQKALEKDPDERYQTMRDLGIDLRRLKHDTESAKLAPTATAVPARARRRPLLYALVGLVLAGGGWLLFRSRTPADFAPLRLTFTQLTDQPGPENFPSLSPDGKSFVYASRASGNWDIYLQRVGGKNPINLTEDSLADDTQPVFSPDGEWIAFRSSRESRNPGSLTGGGIFVMGATGESVRRLTDAGSSPAWAPDGKEIVFATEGLVRPEMRHTTSQLWIISLTTGEKRLFSKGDAVQPHWSPHGHRIAYWFRDTYSDSGQRGLATVAAQGGGRVLVSDGRALDWNPVWSPDGRYLYFSSDRGGSMNLWRAPIEERSGKVLGPPEPVTTPSPYSGHLSFSRDGRLLAYVHRASTSNVHKIGFDPGSEKIVGQPVAATQGSREVDGPAISRDGRWLVFASGGHLFVSGSDGTGLRQLTNGVPKDNFPRWSPDGRRVVFSSSRGGRNQEVWIINADGSGLDRLTETTGGVWHPSWAPDGTRLVYYDVEAGRAVIVEAGKSWKEQSPQTLPAFVPASRFAVFSWSPDGRRLAGVQYGEARFQGILTYSFSTQRFEKLTEFGRDPVWLADSRRIVFHDWQEKIYLVDSQSRVAKEVLSVAPNSLGRGVSVSVDNRTIYFSLEQEEADIWLATQR